MKRLALLVALVATMALGAAGTAGAAPKRTLATPSNVCGALVKFGAGDYGTFGNCMRHLNGDVAAFRYPATEDPNSPLISLAENCKMLEQMIPGFAYPFTFEEGPEWPFPVYTAQNRKQCERTLFAYHTLASLFGPAAA